METKVRIQQGSILSFYCFYFLGGPDENKKNIFTRIFPLGDIKSLSDYFFYFVCEAVGTEATPGLLCQLWVIVKMIVEKIMEGRLAGETEVLGENLP
jgi:hypothetical protein